MLGTYHYSRVVGGSLDRYTCRVEILEQNAKRVKIKLLQFHVDGRRPGSVMKVKPSNVTPDVSAAPVAAPEAPAIRLPYKDSDED